jgi:hypothetical protein
MFILNAGLSHKSNDWLMSSTTEIEKTKRGWTEKELKRVLGCEIGVRIK